MTSVGEQFNQLVEVALQAEKKQTAPEEGNILINETTKSKDFLQENKNIGKKYKTTHIKSRNFFLNIAYVGISKDYYNENFVFDVYLPLKKNLNSFSISR